MMVEMQGEQAGPSSKRRVHPNPEGVMCSWTSEGQRSHPEECGLRAVGNRELVLEIKKKKMYARLQCGRSRF